MLDLPTHFVYCDGCDKFLFITTHSAIAARTHYCYGLCRYLAD